MKIRNGFVSNSSSSSFICDITGQTKSGWDVSLEDAEMYECENGHTMCEHFVEQHIAEIAKRGFEACLNSFSCEEDKKNFQKMFDDNCDADLVDVVQETLNESDNARYYLSAKLCPICQLTYLCTEDILKYMLITSKKSYEGVCKEIKSHYKDVDKFYKEMNNVGLR